ncbi:hypothetical protein ES703_64053 [subsurface metagenome]
MDRIDRINNVEMLGLEVSTLAFDLTEESYWSTFTYKTKTTPHFHQFVKSINLLSSPSFKLLTGELLVWIFPFCPT